MLVEKTVSELNVANADAASLIAELKARLEQVDGFEQGQKIGRKKIRLQCSHIFSIPKFVFFFFFYGANLLTEGIEF